MNDYTVIADPDIAAYAAGFADGWHRTRRAMPDDWTEVQIERYECGHAWGQFASFGRG